MVSAIFGVTSRLFGYGYLPESIKLLRSAHKAFFVLRTSNISSPSRACPDRLKMRQQAQIGFEGAKRAVDSLLKV